MARPRKAPDERRVAVPLRLPAALLEDFDAIAAKANLSRSAAIERLVSRAVERTKSPTPSQRRDVEPRFKS